MRRAVSFVPAFLSCLVLLTFRRRKNSLDYSLRVHTEYRNIIVFPLARRRLMHVNLAATRPRLGRDGE